MRARYFGLLCLGFILALLAKSNAATAETCFHACFKGRNLPTDVTNQTMRDVMQSCHDKCEKAARSQLIQEGFGPVLAACIPQRLSEAELRKIRSASASVMAFASAFTWDVKNVLPDKIIRRVELSTQTMSLESLVVSAAGYVGPGQTGTFYIGNVTPGYPAVQLSSRVEAIYACPTK